MIPILTNPRSRPWVAMLCALLLASCGGTTNSASSSRVPLCSTTPAFGPPASTHVSAPALASTAFTRLDADGIRRLVVLRPTGAEDVVATVSLLINVSWNAARSMAAVYSEPNRVSVVASDGHVLSSLAVPPDIAWIALAPDGNLLAFERVGHDDIYLANRLGTRAFVKGRSSDDGQISWAPDGTEISFASAGRIFVATVSNGKVRGLDRAPSDGADSAPAWSPDGKWIAFSHGALGIYLVGRDGSGLHALIPGFGPPCGSRPQWSPDGSSLAFILRSQPPEPQAAELMTARIDGTSVSRIAPDVSGPGAGTPDWSPDSQQVLFYRGRAGQHIFSVMVKSGQEREMASGSVADAVWLPG